MSASQGEHFYVVFFYLFWHTDPVLLGPEDLHTQPTSLAHGLWGLEGKGGWDLLEQWEPSGPVLA